MNRTNAINTLVGLRVVVGVLSWLMPRPAGKLFGLDSKGNPQAPYLARLFGARDIALAYGAVSSEGEHQRQWLTVGLACDVADSVAGIAGGRRGYLPKFASVLVTATAVGAAALGAVALGQE
ncbi:MAG TPA: hypothetical protein VID70_07150 [Solirubrobacteraceae bacterium]|jgi:hypothetical protein